jgi:hypothetical protein
MRSKTLGAAFVAAIALTACSNDATSPEDAAVADDYALVMFGSSGSALENTLGTQAGRPFDGRSGAPRLPEELALSDAQKAEIEALRAAFKTEHQTELDALHAIFEAAKTAREAGATRAEVHDILDDGRPIGEALRDDVQALHESIRAVFTADQQAWLEANRPHPPHDLDGRPRRDDRRRPPPGR